MPLTETSADLSAEKNISTIKWIRKIIDFIISTKGCIKMCIAKIMFIKKY